MNEMKNANATEDSDSSNEVPYVIGGAVFGIFIVIILIVVVALAVIKLRKREETLSAATTNATTTIEIHEENANTEQPSMEHQQQCQSNPESNNNSKAAIVKNNKNGQQVTFVRTQGTGTNDHVNVIDNSEWTFPPKAPTPHIYHCINPELLVDKSSFKGFRKQFSGRFKRLVARKPEPAPVIPPELKPQLKTIYVY